MKNIHQRVQTASNVAIILVALLFGVVVIKGYLFPVNSTNQPPSLSRQEKRIPAGTKLTMPGLIGLRAGSR